LSSLATLVGPDGYDLALDWFRYLASLSATFDVRNYSRQDLSGPSTASPVRESLGPLEVTGDLGEHPWWLLSLSEQSHLSPQRVQGIFRAFKFDDFSPTVQLIVLDIFSK